MKWVLGLSSVGGLGYLPAPGTMGSLAALPLWWWSSSFGFEGRLVAALSVVVVSVPICELAEKHYGTHDVGHIVIDEVAGLILALVATTSWTQALIMFGAFRVFDIVKPYPISWFDREVGGGFGVVVDDLVAGVVAALCVHAAYGFLG